MPALHEDDWKKHPTTDFLVSGTGRVLSYLSGRWRELKPSDNGSGYLRVGVGHGNPTYVHRLVAETYHGLRDGFVVNHIDGDKYNNSPSNLEWVTALQNTAHAWATGLKTPAGEKPVRIVETGQVFRSQAECARYIGGIQGNIALCLTGKRRSHRGYTFEYA